MRHPIARGLLMIHARMGLRDMGFRFPEIYVIMSGCDDDLITQAEQKSGVTLPDAAMMGATAGVSALDDHPILKFIIDFLKSPEGQALLKALLMLLLAAIGL